MFGKSTHGYRDVQLQERDLNNQYGITHISEFKMTDISDPERNSLFIIKFEADEQLLAVPDKVKIIGWPGREGFYATHYTYIGLSKYCLMHSNLFNTRLNTMVKNWAPEEIAKVLMNYSHDMRRFLKEHIGGDLIAFGYDKDHRQWRLLTEIYDQAAVGDVVNYRVLMKTHPQRILARLNEKFPTGKKG